MTETLAPAPVKNKPNLRAKPRQSAKYGVPPRKPRSPRQSPKPLAKPIVVASSPGVQVPDGSEPEGDATEALPQAIANEDLLASAPVELAEAGEPRSKNRPENVKAGVPPQDGVSIVGNFFKSIIDLVNPLTDSTPPEPSQKSAESEITRPRPKPAPDKAEDDDLMAGEQIQALEEDVLDSLRPGTNDEPELTDALETLEDDGTLELESLEEELQQEPEPDLKIAEAPKTSASARTLERIKGLLGDDPNEDEFGLPTVEIPVGELSARTNAADDVLDRLAETDDSPSGFLDDLPGPETGPARQPIGEGRQRVPASDALRARLRRLDDAVTRDVIVDTNEILRQGRDRPVDLLDKPSEKRATTPRKMSPRRSDQLMDRVIRPEAQITKRQTPANRFSDRLERIKQSEQLSDGNRVSMSDEQLLPSGGKAGVRPVSPSQLKTKQGAEQEPTTVDRLIGFFGGAQTQPSAPKPEKPDLDAPDYRGAPSTRKLPEEPPAPEIENLEAFDQEDETKPTQSTGSLEPVFLDRLAGLFNEEEANQAAGWKAEVKADDPFPGRGDYVNNSGASSWTTTVEMNVGEGKDPVVIQVAQSPDEGLEQRDLERDQAAVSQPGQTISRQTGSKQSAMAKEAYGDPLREPDKDPFVAKQKTFYGRLTKLFQPKDPVELKRESLLLEADEKLSTAHDALDGGVKIASRTEGDPKNYWPITSLTKSDPPVSAPRRPGALTRTSLSDVTLTLGSSVNLLNLFPPGENGIDPNNECVKKNRGTTLFCIEPIAWPEDLQQSFVITTILYTGSMAIVRYDQTVPTRLHTLFSSDDFEKVATYYQNKFGEPTEILKRSIAPLAKPRQDNPTISWRSKDQKTNAITVLEIRKFDDTRGGFPDTNRGAVMLYYTTSPSIFPQVSSHELMRLKRIGDITQSEAEKTASESSNETPVGGPAVSEDELFGSEPIPVDENPSAATDAVLDALPDNEPTSDEAGGLFERPEDVLNEPDLLEPLAEPDLSEPLAEPGLLESDLLEPTLSQPDTLEPVLTEPDLLAPEIRAGDNLLQDGLVEEPIMDEQPDEVFEILPSGTRNPS